jgi:hypothetical protein
MALCSCRRKSAAREPFFVAEPKVPCPSRCQGRAYPAQCERPATGRNRKGMKCAVTCAKARSYSAAASPLKTNCSDLQTSGVGIANIGVRAHADCNLANPRRREITATGPRLIANGIANIGLVRTLIATDGQENGPFHAQTRRVSGDRSRQACARRHRLASRRDRRERQSKLHRTSPIARGRR